MIYCLFSYHTGFPSALQATFPKLLHNPALVQYFSIGVSLIVAFAASLLRPVAGQQEPVSGYVTRHFPAMPLRVELWL